MKAPAWLDRFAFGPVAAVRPWLLLKATLLLLAVDVWHTHLGPAWRYGAAGFNVAHFAWMDGLPLPTREAYVAMLVVVGVSAFVLALVARPPRALLVLVASLYTWGWSCSMHDSYQHHYLISLVLFAFCFFPALDAKQLFGELGGVGTAARDERPRGKKKDVAARVTSAPAPAWLAALPHGVVPRVHAVGYVLVTSLSVVVYCFTAISKSEIEWRDGDALRNITHGGQDIPDVVSIAHALGMTDDTMFWLMGHGVILVQLVIALGYALASTRDGDSTLEERTRLGDHLVALHAERVRIVIVLVTVSLVSLAASRIVGVLPALALLLISLGAALPRAFVRFCFAPLGRPSAHAIVATVALASALSFHVGAEYIGLQIGWFSYYMIVLAFLALAPAHWMSAVAIVVSAPFRAGSASWLTRWTALGPLLGIIAAVAAVLVGTQVDIPGAHQASVLIAIASFLAGFSILVRPSASTDRARALLATTLGMLVLWASVSSGDERYDYYRFAGGDFRRRHEYPQALEAYRAADRYAPEGQSRATQIEQMERLIESGAR